MAHQVCRAVTANAWLCTKVYAQTGQPSIKPDQVMLACMPFSFPGWEAPAGLLLGNGDYRAARSGRKMHGCPDSNGLCSALGP